jgi:hypothetical protein
MVKASFLASAMVKLHQGILISNFALVEGSSHCGNLFRGWGSVGYRAWG